MKKQNGYVLDAPYPIFFYKEMQPLWLNTVLKFSGFNTIDIDKKFSYLELGCATGINLLVCAILNPHGQFIGVDLISNILKKQKG
ncbi:class I SAM-dependent methyltransferase [Acinetobacter equi]|uniref:class I SAM-dependent methyltransferase n=1 Tax=Acinetobacter equi TaxID=1324350 RepID=UPI000B32DC79|nr:class I SAM-dependent methyltransferase [Acinetobacter equi]